MEGVNCGIVTQRNPREEIKKYAITDMQFGCLVFYLEDLVFYWLIRKLLEGYHQNSETIKLLLHSFIGGFLSVLIGSSNKASI